MSRERPPDFRRGWAGGVWTDPDLSAEDRATLQEILASRNYFIDSATFEDWKADREHGRAHNAVVFNRKPGAKKGGRGGGQGRFC